MSSLPEKMIKKYVAIAMATSLTVLNGVVPDS
jgi:hypothetical protein